MTVDQVVPGVYQVPLGIVNVFLLVGEDVTVIDTGTPGSAPKIIQAVREIGKSPWDVRHILLTHLHADHTGGAKALCAAVAADGGSAKIYMHSADAEAFRLGRVMRPVEPAPGLFNKLVVNLLMKRVGPSKVDPGPVDHLVVDGDELPVAGGLKIIHTPGHTAGHLVLLWPQQGGVLFAGDACGRMVGGLGYPLLFEDFEQGKQALHRLAGLSFEYAVFGHGKPIRGGASEVFRQKWG